MPAIGIDLGTTHSCVAVWLNDKVEIIHNEQGYNITPSYVAFTDNERLIGNAAKNQAALNPENTVFDSKRLIGRKFGDDVVQKDMKLWPFTVVNDGGNPKIAAEYKGEKKSYAPEEISSMVLTKMKEIAEAYLKEEVYDAVITVPAYFSIHQREATRDAGKIAGLKVLGIISEPTAAALAYGLDKCHNEKRNIMIYDLGGGTFDVSIMTIHGTSFVVKATSGDTHLGGGDFDNILINHFCDEFQRKYKKDVRKSKYALGRLRKEAEKAKKSLSSSNTARLYIENFFDGIDFKTQISRIRFEEICKDLFESTLDPVERALKDAGLTKSQIDDVVLVGGSTRILKIQELIQKFFDGKKLTMNINADEAVAYGAAVHAAALSKSRGVPMVLLKDVTPLSLGIETVGFVFTIIVPRNTQLPFEIEDSFTTEHDYQKSITIQVYEGENRISTKNILLGKFELSGILSAPAHVPRIRVKFQLDTDGLLNTTAIDADTGSTNNIHIKIDKGRYSEEEINRMISEAEQFRADDVRESERLYAYSKLESFAIIGKQRASEAGSNLSEFEKQAIIARCKKTIDWLEDNHSAEIEIYQSKLRALQTFCQPLQINFDKFDV